MKINQISFYNIGNSNEPGSDFFDVLKPGVSVFYGESSYVLIKYYFRKKNYDLIENNYDINWWDLCSDHIINSNDFIIQKDLLSGLLQASCEEDEDALYEFSKKNSLSVKFDTDVNQKLRNVGFFCIKQTDFGEYEYVNKKLFKQNKETNILDLFGIIDEYESLLVYLE